MRTIIIEIKNSVGGLNSKTGLAVERHSHLEDRVNKIKHTHT